MRFKKLGFTLSEILITLTVIGVLVAITISTLHSMWQKQALKSAFIKTYSNLNSIAEKFKADEGISFSEYAYENGYNATYDKFSSYMKFNHNSPIAKGRHDSVDYNFLYKTISGTKTGPRCDDKGLYPDISGRLIGMDNPPLKENTNGPVICADTNGLKGPNKYGYDFFLFLFTLDGKVIPFGMDYPNNPSTPGGKDFHWYTVYYMGSDHCSKTKANSNGQTCAYYALSDKHPTKKGKTYWKDFL